MIAALSVGTIAGRLGAPARNARGSVGERRSLLITLESDSGAFGQGEASPLPGYSPDTIEECAAACAELASRPLAVDAEADAPSILALAAAQLPEGPPAARFALEMALVDLVARVRSVPAWSLFGAPQLPEPPLAALLGVALDPALPERATSALERGLTTLKVKIGAGDWDDELRALRGLRARLPSGVRLRLDANRSLPAADLGARLRELAALELEFVEEPAPLAALKRLDEVTAPIALDESLQDLAAGLELIRRSRIAGLRAVVLKPMALGGLQRARTLAEAARARGLDVVISHLFDGPLALSAAALLAFDAGSAGTAVGLDRHAGLGAWAHPSPALGTKSLLAWTEPGLGLPRLGSSP